MRRLFSSGPCQAGVGWDSWSLELVHGNYMSGALHLTLPAGAWADVMEPLQVLPEGRSLQQHMLPLIIIPSAGYAGEREGWAGDAAQDGRGQVPHDDELAGESC